MSKSALTARNTAQSPTSLSIETLEEIVRNCQRNEERLHELERHTRHERKKAERLLRETYHTMQDRDNQHSFRVENYDNNHTVNQKFNSRPSKQFYVSLDDENEGSHSRSTIYDNNTNVRQDKDLLERIEKLLAGDGTTASSEIKSSQERQKGILDSLTSSNEDGLDERALNIDDKNLPESRQLPSACSIENELSTVDHLLSERTPINNHRIKSDIHFNRENQVNKPIDYNNEENILSDNSNWQLHKRSINNVRTDRLITNKPTTVYDETYPYQSRLVSKITNKKDEELADLARRCEDLLARLHSQRNRAALLENSLHHYDHHQRQTSPTSLSYELKQPYHHRSRSSPPPSAPPQVTLQQALELLRPDFISRSRQRVRRIRLLREEREHNAEIERERQQMLLFSCTNCCSNRIKRVASAPPTRHSISFIVPYDRSDSSRLPLTYHQIKIATKKKYDQLPEVNNRRRQNQMDEIRRRNLLRAKIFRTRLRQHVARHGRTNIDESLTMINA